MNTKTLMARTLLLGAFLILTPIGGLVMNVAFEQQPYVFIMLIFSGSLMLLVGLTGLVGFIASFSRKGAPCDETISNDQEESFLDSEK